jgi:hypothetical protein
MGMIDHRSRSSFHPATTASVGSADLAASRRGRVPPAALLATALRTNIGNVATLDDAVAALNPSGRITGKTIISVRL